MARTDGLFKTAKALRLEHSRLKVRARVVEGREGASDPGPETAFVEVGFESLGSSRTVMEFVGRDGDRMRIDVTSSSPVDVVGLSRAFWGRQL